MVSEGSNFVLFEKLGYKILIIVSSIVSDQIWASTTVWWGRDGSDGDNVGAEDAKDWSFDRAYSGGSDKDGGIAATGWW